jgi:hypothetical protein
LKLTKLSLHRLINLEGLVQPLVAFSGQNELGRTQTVSNILKAVDQTVGEVVGREHLPGGSPDMLLLLLGNSVGGKIPHLGVAVLDILFHAEERSLGLILAVVHVLELLQIGLHILLSVLASVSRTLLALLSSALELDLGFAAVANIGLFLLDELLCKVKEPLEVVARVCNGAGGKA